MRVFRLFTSSVLISVSLFATSAYARTTAVIAATVEEKPVAEEIEALGTLHAIENVSLTSSVTEMITKINFKDNQKVKKGDLLLEMDATEQIALKLEEESRLLEARSQLKRYQKLYDQGSLSKSVLDAQKLIVETSKARIAAVNSQIKLRRIVAPFDGVVGQRNFSVGALVQPGTVITTLDDLSVMKLDFSIPELYLSSLNVDMQIKASTSVWPNQMFTGTVVSINTRVDPITRAVTVRALLKNEDLKLRPGMLMRIKLQKLPRQALLIPEESVLVKGANHFVFKVITKEEKQTAERTQVTLGKRLRGQVEVVEGLVEGDKIIAHGAVKVRPGQAVSIKAEYDDQTNIADIIKH